MGRIKGYIYNTWMFFKKKGYKSGGVMIENLYTLDSNSILQGKNILITGGGSGIGLATAKRCIESGAKVVITGRNEEKLEKAIRLIGGDIDYVVWDVTETKRIADVIKQCETFFGGAITGLVNNAGFDERREFYEVDESFFDSIINVHLRAVYFLTQEIVKHMQANEVQGSICMITSQSALINDFRPYNLAKAAVNNYVQGIAKYGMANGRIRCNAVAPGVVSTDLYTEFTEIRNSGNTYKGNLPDKRFKRAEEIAEIVQFCLSDLSKCMTGQILVCDGGKAIL